MNDVERDSVLEEFLDARAEQMEQDEKEREVLLGTLNKEVVQVPIEEPIKKEV